jgi:4'-phosphopantetheinyl transferase
MTRSRVDHRQGLSRADVHIWTAKVSARDSATTDLLRILDEEEQERAARLTFARDRMRFIQTHGIVRQILSSYCDTEAAALTFVRNGQGKPYLVPQTNGPRLQFSVSHSGDYCVLALRLDDPIGIDIEEVRYLSHAIDIAKSYFTPEESRALATVGEEHRCDTFFVWWTHKEAAVKALGLSLAANLGRVEFAFNPAGSLRLAAWDGHRSVARKWFTRRLDPAPGYIAAVAGVHPIRSLTLRTWDYPSGRTVLISP